ncbi:MAG TPA: hypothetical protein VFG62_15665 [Rhodopila sp.]|jgi:VIT1/CCC1 family predicted Fe2+/Mn2+ transporter|nr:hypothetical protein [Rhodopila sp.]
MFKNGWIHRIATVIAFSGGVALPLLPISFVPNVALLTASALAVLFAFSKEAWIV